MIKQFKRAAWALLGAGLTWLGSGPGAAAAGSVPTAKPESAGLSAERLARIHTAMQAQIDAGNIAGVVTLVDWRNPHVHVFFNVTQQDKSVENWAVELESPADEGADRIVVFGEENLVHGVQGLHFRARRTVRSS